MLDDLLIFVEVVKSGSISAASRHLKIHQSQISRSVKKLEEIFNKPLLYRDARRMIKTEYGQLLFESVNSSIVQIDSAVENYRFLVNNNSGWLQIIVPPIFADYFVNPKLNDFLAEYPNLKVNISFSFKDVAEYDTPFDLAITTVYPSKNNFVVKKYFDSKPILCASKTYIEKYGQPKTIDDLESHIIIIPKINNIEYFKWEFYKENNPAYCEEREIINYRLTYDNNLAGKLLVQNGAGITPVLDFTVIDQLKSGELVRVLPDFHLRNIPFYLVRPNKYKNIKTDAFISFLDNNRKI